MLSVLIVCGNGPPMPMSTSAPLSVQIVLRYIDKLSNLTRLASNRYLESPGTLFNCDALNLVATSAFMNLCNCIRRKEIL